MNIFFSFLISLTVISACCQEKPCQRKKENTEWIHHLKSKTTIEEQLFLIKRKIYSDTLFCDEPHRVILLDRRNEDDMICKTIIVIEHNGKYFHLDLQKRSYLYDLIRKINKRKVVGVEILDSYKSAVYFGEMGSCGVVVVKATKKFGRRIEKKYK
ncbi:hypothetical protein [Flavobacterium sp. U410]